MKLENDLKITGIVVSDITTHNPGNAYARFRIVHNYKDGRKPL